MKYRSEIDGLRALAVLPVIFFHAGFDFFSGGFVGVDVFFVISGYLITTVLIEDIENNRFSIIDFYERRARRILPALFFVIFVCIPFAWSWMSPSQMKDFSQSLVAVSLFASNVLFWQESGYFSGAAEEKPMLHTWSLAVEEQYYVLFPIFLFAAWRFGKTKVFWIIVVFSAFSFAFSEWSSRNSPIANFYLLQTRAWELFAGSIAAFVVQKRGVQTNNALSFVGIASIIFSIIVYDEKTPFPGIFALVPVIGTVLLILYADNKTFVAKLLSTKAFVGIGLISYSAYLWHQPLFAFARISTGNQAGSFIFILLSFFSLLLAWLSWLAVEKPFRDKNLVSRRVLFSGSILIFMCLIVFGFSGHLTEGYDTRFSVNELSTVKPRVGDSSGCLNELEAEEIREGNVCFVSNDENFARSIALVGDSHAATIIDSLSDSLADLRLGFFAFTRSWCAPLAKFATNVERKDQCVLAVNSAYEKILSNQDIESVILFAEWANYHHGNRWDDSDKAPYLFAPNGNFEWETASIERNIIELEKAIKHTFDLLKKSGKKVIVVLPVPEYSNSVPNIANPKIPFVNRNDFRLEIETYMERSREVRQLLTDNALRRGFFIVDPKQIFCDDDFCYPFKKDGSYYLDSNHLSYLGSSLLVPEIVDLISTD